MIDLNNITVERLMRDFEHNGAMQTHTFYAIARNSAILMDRWSDGSETPTMWESKPYDLQDAIDTRDPHLIAVLTETQDEQVERIAKREQSYREFMAALTR